MDHNSQLFSRLKHYARQRLFFAKMAIIDEDMVLCGFFLFGGIEWTQLLVHVLTYPCVCVCVCVCVRVGGWLGITRGSLGSSLSPTYYMMSLAYSVREVRQ